MLLARFAQARGQVHEAGGDDEAQLTVGDEREAVVVDGGPEAVGVSFEQQGGGLVERSLPVDVDSRVRDLPDAADDIGVGEDQASCETAWAARESAASLSRASASAEAFSLAGSTNR